MEPACPYMSAAEVPKLDLLCLLINKAVEAAFKVHEPDGPPPKLPRLHNQDSQLEDHKEDNKQGLFVQGAELSDLFKHIKEVLRFLIPPEDGTDEDFFMKYQCPDPDSLPQHSAIR
ncbi:hypothetical protein NDU88_002575 [Pleurodeles waltl]|uniref:Uncharacterized protein n=1 Tax=Pleurodeles waltl TaxID=8319 RepID=A0AAV7T413_PLEWA|nr:hypothetical protein NDU88_002575 [Pleurodeles waltl]